MNFKEMVLNWSNRGRVGTEKGAEHALAFGGSGRMYLAVNWHSWRSFCWAKAPIKPQLVESLCSDLPKSNRGLVEFTLMWYSKLRTRVFPSRDPTEAPL